MRQLMAFGLSIMLSTGLIAAPAQGAKSKSSKKTPAVTAAEVQALREQMAAQQQQLKDQQQQIEELKRDLHHRDDVGQQAQQQLQQVQAAAAEAQSKASVVEVETNRDRESVAKLSSDMADVKTTLTNTAATIQEDQKHKTPAVEPGFGKIKFDGLLQAWAVAGGEGVTNTFRLRRTELKFSGQITPRASWTITIDPAKALSLNSTTTPINGTSVLTSASVNQASRILQDAYITLGYIPHVRLDFGQTKIPLSLEGFQSSAKLDTVERALFMSDKGRGGSFGDIRDFGVMISGPLTRVVDYQVGLFNGSGEHQNESATFDQKSVIGRVVVKPFRGFQVGGSGALGYGITNSTTRPRRDRLGAEIMYTRGPLALKSEWMEGKDGEVLRQGYYAHIGYKIRGRIEPIFRLDAFDPDVSKDTSKSDVLERDYLAGFNYYITEHNWKVQLNYGRKTFARDLVSGQNVVLMNLQTSW